MLDIGSAPHSTNGETTALAFPAASSADHLLWPPIARRFKLTPREDQVLYHIWQGRKFASIAHLLRITLHTVDVHWRRIKAKLDLPPGHESIRAACRLIESIRLELRVEEATKPLKEELAAAKAEIERLKERVRELEAAKETIGLSDGNSGPELRSSPIS
jgi:hypothetical protein